MKTWAVALMLILTVFLSPGAAQWQQPFNAPQGYNVPMRTPNLNMAVNLHGGAKAELLFAQIPWTASAGLFDYSLKDDFSAPATMTIPALSIYMQTLKGEILFKWTPYYKISGSGTLRGAFLIGTGQFGKDPSTSGQTTTVDDANKNFCFSIGQTQTRLQLGYLTTSYMKPYLFGEWSNITVDAEGNTSGGSSQRSSASETKKMSTLGIGVDTNSSFQVYPNQFIFCYARGEIQGARYVSGYELEGGIGARGIRSDLEASIGLGYKARDVGYRLGDNLSLRERFYGPTVFADVRF